MAVGFGSPLSLSICSYCIAEVKKKSFEIALKALLVEVAGPPSKARMNSAEQARQQAAHRKRKRESHLRLEAISHTQPFRPTEKAEHWLCLFCWSKWRDSNSRPPVPEQIRHCFLTTFVDFLVLFSPKTMLMRALVSTVST